MIVLGPSSKEPDIAFLVSTLYGADGRRELVEFGKRIGLKPTWLRGEDPTLHFQLAGHGVIDRAREAGAREVPRTELAAITAEKRRLMAGRRP